MQQATSEQPKRRSGKRPDGVWKLAVKWKNNPQMMYYRSTRKQDLRGNGGELVAKKVLGGKYDRAGYAALYYGNIKKLEWTEGEQQWRTPKPTAS
ncbi:MAG: hypothetical protein AAFY91_16825 [Bacteroidota bacterium]